MDNKQYYESPDVQVLEVRLEGCITVSAPGFDDGGDLLFS